MVGPRTGRRRPSGTAKRDPRIVRALSDHPRHGRAPENPVRPVPRGARQERGLSRWLCPVPRVRVHTAGDCLGKERQGGPIPQGPKCHRRDGPRHPKDIGSEEGPMKQGSKLTPKGAKIVAALERFRDAIEAGTPIEQRYTVRRVKLDLTPRTFGPDEVKGIRAMMGVSQPIFGQFLGVDVKTVRSWEQGRRVPSGMACRFLEEIQASPEHWRSRLNAVLGASDR